MSNDFITSNADSLNRWVDERFALKRAEQKSALCLPNRITDLEKKIGRPTIHGIATRTDSK